MIRVEALLVLLIASGIIVVAFACNAIFRRSGFPDIIFLLLFGILLGPVLGLFTYEALLPLAPYLTVLALAIIMFSAGLDLDFRKVVSQSPRAIILAFVYVALGTVLVAMLIRSMLQLSWLQSFMFGPMVAGTSSVVIVPLVSKIKIDRRVALTLSLESEITDALNVIILFSIVHAYVLGVITVGEVVTSIVSSFSIGTVLGFLFGLLWLNILHFVRREEYVYMLTVAAVLLCYTTVEWLTGSGILSVLLFGLVLGNDKRFIDFLKLKINPLTKKMKTFLASFQAELSFLIRAFFFVFLGLLYQFSLVGLAFALAFVAITLAARHFAVAASLFRSPLNTSKNKNFMTLMSGRGLAAATLSTIPLQFDLPNAMLYVMIVANVILISNILMVIPLWMIKKKKRV